MEFLERFAPIAILLVVVGIVLTRLPKAEGITHSGAFRKRRVMNWLPLGLTYMFLYMGRYNLTVSKKAFGALMDTSDFSAIFAAGTLTYGASFLINGPLTDKFGGKFSILLGAAGACVANILMGLCTYSLQTNGTEGFVGENFVLIFKFLYAMNMYFQSFGAVAIVKSNAPWFHVRERGVFGSIFGILISLGIYFAFDVGAMIRDHFGVLFVFVVPAVALAIFFVVDFILVRNTPGEAGFDDFDTADASSGDDGPQLGPIKVFKLMFSQPIIITIALIEFCSGFLRQSIMNYYRIFSRGVGTAEGSFVYENWGMLLCCAGIVGGIFAGTISDRVFHSRRGPVASVLYGLMVVGAIALTFLYTTPAVGILVIVMSLAVIGVHGMLSGTASMDFGGKKNVGIAVGIIDGFVYAGTGCMAILYSYILPDGDAAKSADNWLIWPISMIPVALVGLLLATRIWNAKPKPKAK